MHFAEALLTEDLTPLRQQLLLHPLWERIEAGTLERERLRIFALQDWWLVREAYRLDALAIANSTDLEMQEILIGKLQARHSRHNHIRKEQMNAALMLLEQLDCFRAAACD